MTGGGGERPGMHNGEGRGGERRNREGQGGERRGQGSETDWRTHYEYRSVFVFCSRLNKRYKYLSITFPKLAPSYIPPHQSLPTPVPLQKKYLREAIVGYASDYGVVIIKLHF